jgi:hypothetical protein
VPADKLVPADRLEPPREISSPRKPRNLTHSRWSDSPTDAWTRTVSEEFLVALVVPTTLAIVVGGLRTCARCGANCDGRSRPPSR